MQTKLRVHNYNYTWCRVTEHDGASCRIGWVYDLMVAQVRRGAYSASSVRVYLKKGKGRWVRLPMVVK